MVCGVTDVIRMWQHARVNDDNAMRLPDGFEFTGDTDRVDRARVHAWLADESYWARGRPREVQDRAIDGSRNYSILRAATGEQVAYARVVTDGVTFAWLCDVFVDPAVRGLGIGTALVANVVASLDELQLNRVMLATSDAHGLYRKFGFEDVKNPERWMSREWPVRH